MPIDDGVAAVAIFPNFLCIFWRFFVDNERGEDIEKDEEGEGEEEEKEGKKLVQQMMVEIVDFLLPVFP